MNVLTEKPRGVEVTDPSEIAALIAMGKYRDVHWKYDGTRIFAKADELREWRLRTGKIR